MNRFFLYCRKSSEAEDRQVLSIQSQEGELQRIAERVNGHIVEVLSEAKSAKEPGRPVFNAMMKRIAAGEADAILCWKLDRLARNPIDGGTIIWAVNQHGVKIVTPSQTFQKDDDSVVLMWVEFGMAHKFVIDLRKNVQRGMTTKAQMGWMPAMAPLGYLNTRRDTGIAVIDEDPRRFHLVRRVWELLLTGQWSIERLLHKATVELGLRSRPTRKRTEKPLSISGIYALFTNPFYYGEFEHPNRSGIWYKGAHTPMITRDEFDRAQVILGRTDRERSQKHSFAFVGIFRCGECGAMITAEEKWKRQENGNVHHYIYYHCTKRQTPRCPQKSIEEEELVRQISAFLMGLDVPELFADWAIDHVEQLRHEDDARDEAVIDDLTKRLARIDQSHQELTRMRYERLIADDEFLRERNRLQQEQSRTKEQIDKLTNSNGNWLDPARKAFEMVKSIYTRFTEGDTMMRRTIVLAVGSNLLLKDKKLIIEAKKPFLILQNGFRKVREILGGFEPPTLGFIEPLDSRLAAALAVWCTSVHEVRTSIQDEEVAQIVKRASAEPHSRQSRDRAA